MSVRTGLTWVARGMVALAAAATVDLSLAALEVEHDAPLVALLVVTGAAAALLAIEALDAPVRLPWTVPRADARPESGEDTRTTMLRHLVEAHQAAREADDTVLWQIADLAARRLLQVHDLRWSEDPERALALLGPTLADLVSRDRRHRYEPDQRHRRYSTGELGELVKQVEQL